MAHENDWRRNRGGPGSSWNQGRPDPWRNAQVERGYASDYPRDRPRDRGEPPDTGFQRRGWRPGSDYYGNDASRYGGRGGGNYDPGNYDPGSYESAGARRGVWENQDIDYGGRDTGRASFNDRWQQAYRGPAREVTPFEGPFRGRGPKGYKRSDERIREDVCERLTQDDHVDASNVEVTVKNCEVTLSGTVGSREEKRRAEDLADSISGVTDVNNKLRISDERAPEAEQNRSSAAAQGTPQASQPSQGSRH